MSLCDAIDKIVNFLRAGYPRGVAATDVCAVLALLRRRLSDDEVRQIVMTLVQRGSIPIDATDIRVIITKFTNEMPSPEEVERVKHHLGMCRWPIIEEFPHRA